MLLLIDKKKRIFIYVLCLFFLTSIFNTGLKNKILKVFSIKDIEYGDNDLNIKVNKYLNKNIFSLNKDKISTILKNNPIIDTLQVKKIYPNKLKINIIETNALAKIFIKSDLFYVGQNQKIFKKKINISNLPLIKGNPNIQKINFFLELLTNSPLQNQNINFLIYHDSNRWDIILDNNIVFKLPENINKNLFKNISLLIEDMDLKNKIVDMRIINKIVISDE
tara:strand:+ start:2648 stop:3313 length:666 start_codon:yes stop_codon:yes gene_type:complete